MGLVGHLFRGSLLRSGGIAWRTGVLQSVPEVAGKSLSVNPICSKRQNRIRQHYTGMRFSISLTYWYIPWIICLVLEALVLYNYYWSDDTERAEPAASIPEAVEPMTPPSGCNVTYTRPYFLGCGFTDLKQGGCQPIPLDEWLQLHLRYPTGSQTHQTAGIAEVSFVVGPDGLVRDPQLIRDPGHGRGYDLLRAFRIMEKKRIAWEPSIKTDTHTNQPHPTSMRLVHRVKYDMVWAAVGTRADR